MSYYYNQGFVGNANIAKAVDEGSNTYLASPQNDDYKRYPHNDNPTPAPFSHSEESSESEEEQEEKEEVKEEVGITFKGIPKITQAIERGALLGNGAFGTVFSGVWKGRPVALKMIDRKRVEKNFKHLNKKDIYQALEWEVARISSVAHPGIVQFYGIYQQLNGNFFIVMEFCEKGTLQKVLEQKKANWGLKIEWSLEISYGLKYLHEQGIIHRDIKAENVLLTNANCAKLADLGVSQVDPLISDSKVEVVESGLQDQRFISPEAFSSRKNSSTLKSDVYALGLVFWQMLTDGTIPQKPNSLKIFLERETIISIGNPENYVKMIENCMKVDPLQRSNIEEVIQQLNACVQEDGNALLRACRKIEEGCYMRYIESLHFITPYVVTQEVIQVDAYWKVYEFYREKFDLEQLKYYENHYFGERVEMLDFGLKNQPISLDEAFFNFLNSKEFTLTLFGNAGNGKSLSIHLLAYKLIEEWKEILKNREGEDLKRIYFPLLIRPAIQEWTQTELIDCFMKALRFYQIEKFVHSLNFLIIVDGYDECQLTESNFNIGEALRIPKDVNFKLIITSRPNSNLSEFKYMSSLKIYHFLPFNIIQLLKYLKDHKNWNENQFKSYQDKFKKFDQLRIILRNPFVLKLVTECWDEVIGGVSNFNILDRFKIYEGYIKNWINSKIELLSNNVISELLKGYPSILDSFHHWASNIAIQSYLNDDIKISTKHFKSIDNWSTINDIVEKKCREEYHLKESSNLSLEDYLSIKKLSLYQFFKYSPVQERSDQFEFIHKSFFEFYCAKYLLMMNDDNDAMEKVHLVLSSKIIDNEPEIIKFWIEGFVRRKHNNLIDVLFELIYKSREPNYTNFSARNSATLLNYARVPFSLKDLSKVDISGAFMFNSICYKTNFAHANLKNINFSGSHLIEADFSNSDMTKTKFFFGKGIPLKEFETGHNIALHPDGKIVVSGTENGIIQVFDIESKMNVGQINGHSKAINSLAFTPDGKILASGSDDGTIQLWEAENFKSLGELKGISGKVLCVAFNSNGRVLSAGSSNKNNFGT